MQIYRQIFSVVTVLSFVCTAFAQTTTSSNSVLPSQENSSSSSLNTATDLPQEKSRWGIVAQAEMSGNLANEEDVNRSRDFTYRLVPSYKISDAAKISAAAEYTQNLVEPSASQLSNTKIKLTGREYELTGTKLKLQPAVAGTLPTNKDDVESKSYRGALSLEPRISLQILKSTLAYRYLFTKNFNRYENSSSGSVNVSSIQTSELSLDIPIGTQVTVGVLGALRESTTYAGSKRNSFITNQVLGYAVNDQFSVAVGHGNSGSLLKADQQTTNFALVNENTSTVYSTLTLIY